MVEHYTLKGGVIMDLGVNAYMVEKEAEARNTISSWDPKFPSGLNERIILEKQRPFWDLIERSKINAKIRQRMSEPE